VQSYGKDEWDVMIGPRGPAAEQKADFSADMLLVDNIYVAAPGHDFVDAGQVDKPGVKIGVVQNAVPDQFLSRTLKFAELVRVSAPIEVAVEALRSGKADVFASSGQYAHAVAAGIPNAKIIPRAFLFTHMAVALPKGRSAIARSELAEIINEAKKTGVVQRAIAKSALTDVRAAPN
jgi:polar amino acid transport system substrate-binding protein